MVLASSRVFHQILAKEGVNRITKINGIELLHMKGIDNQMLN